MNKQQSTPAAETAQEERKTLHKDVLDFALPPLFSPTHEEEEQRVGPKHVIPAEDYHTEHSRRAFIGFRSYKLSGRQTAADLEPTKNHVLFMMEGAAKVVLDGASYYLNSNDAIVVCHGQQFQFVAERHCHFATYTFEAFSLPIADYLDKLYKSSIDYRSNYSPVFQQNRILRSYAENIITLLDHKDVWASWFIQNKAYEGFHLMTNSYPANSLLSIFDRLITHNRSFRNVILRHCENVKNVDELIKLTDLSRTNFYKSFNKEFGMPVHQWLQVRRARNVRHDAGLPGMSVKYLMERNGFASASNFIRFCRIYFNCAPLELIHRMQSGRPVPEI